MCVHIHAAKTHLSRLIDAVGEGEKIVIARAGRPVARPMHLAHAARAEQRADFVGADALAESGGLYQR